MTPEHLHHDMTIAALRAGKHVYIEKPLAHTIEEGWDIVKEWEKAKKIVQVGHAEPQFLLYKKAKEMVAAGHDRRRPLRARLLVSQRAAQRAVVALRHSRRGDSAEHRLEPLPGHRAEARLGSASLLPMAPVLGLFGRDLDRPAGAPDRYRQFHAGQDGPEELHGFGRHLPLDRQDATIATCRTPSARSTITPTSFR